MENLSVEHLNANDLSNKTTKNIFSIHISLYIRKLKDMSEHLYTSYILIYIYTQNSENKGIGKAIKQPQISPFV